MCYLQKMNPFALNKVGAGAPERQVEVKLKLASMTKFHKSQNYGGAETCKWAEDVHKGKRCIGKKGQRQEAELEGSSGQWSCL